MANAGRILVPIHAGTRVIALIGHPVSHSLSPAIHNAAFRHHEIDHAYIALNVDPPAVRAAVAGLRALGFAGANVTAPHKQAVMQELDGISPQAAAVGAVNTIVRKDDGRMEGHNTDVEGFLAPLRDYVDRLRGMPMTIIGSGGAARAVAYAILTTLQPKRLTLAARSTDKADHLAADLAAFDETAALVVQPIAAAADAIRTSRLIVNATPVGTHPRSDRTPWTTAGDFNQDQIVYDLVYNPRLTRLLREASDQGAMTIDGLEMLIGQAAAAYTLWTGREMPTHVVREALHATTHEQ